MDPMRRMREIPVGHAPNGRRQWVLRRRRARTPAVYHCRIGCRIISKFSNKPQSGGESPFLQHTLLFDDYFEFLPLEIFYQLFESILSRGGPWFNFPEMDFPNLW